MKLFILLLTVVFSAQAEGIVPWNRIVLAGGSHLMTGFVPPQLKAADTLNIFIEAAGNPGVVPKLAQDIGGNSVYIARPCQYMMGNSMDSCTRALWTSARYSQSVVDSMNRPISAMKVPYQTKKCD